VKYREITNRNGIAIFCIFIDYRGRHRIGAAIYNATYASLQQKLWFHWTKNVFLNTAESFNQEKTLLNYIIFAMKIISVDLFRATPYMLLLVLHKDVLFHWMIKMFFFQACIMLWYYPTYDRIQFTSLDTRISLCIYAPLWRQNHFELLLLWRRLLPPYFWIRFSDPDQAYVCII
jgi:hypothetical protein